MGFWGTLGKIWKPAAQIGSVVAAPFTGGASLAALPAINAIGKVTDAAGKVGQVAGAIAGGMADGRKTENDQQLSRDALNQRGASDRQSALLEAAKLRESGLMDRARLDLDQRKFALDAPGSRASDVVRGDMMANVQDIKFNRPSTIPGGGFTGGLRPSMMGANSRAAGEELSRASLLALMQGDKFEAPEMVSPEIQPAFQASAPKGAGWWEKIMGGVGQGGSLIGALNMKKQGGPTPPSGYTGVPYAGGPVAGSAAVPNTPPPLPSRPLRLM